MARNSGINASRELVTSAGISTDSVFCSQISRVALSGLRNWTAPAVPMSTMLARQFKAFLPPKDKLDLGDPWWIIPSELNIFTGYLPNNRFYPPPPKGKEVRDATQFPCTWELVCVNVLPASPGGSQRSLEQTRLLHSVSLDFLREQKGCSVQPGAPSDKLEIKLEQPKLWVSVVGR